MVSCNLNEHVKFKLTKYGKQILEKHFKNERNMFGIDAHELYKPDHSGYINKQLWEFMRVFGPYMEMGFNPIIERNELVFVGD